MSRTEKRPVERKKSSECNNGIDRRKEQPSYNSDEAAKLRVTLPRVKFLERAK